MSKNNSPLAPAPIPMPALAGTAGDTPNLPRARERHSRGITREDVQDMARLANRRITETEACSLLGISKKAWFGWKYRNKNNEKFSALLDGLRAAKINAAFEHIEKAQKDDWRAADKILERTDPARFSDRNPQTPPPTPPFNLNVLTQTIQLIYGPPGELSPTSPAPELPTVPEPVPKT